jgi:hypothetical protein
VKQATCHLRMVMALVIGMDQPGLPIPSSGREDHMNGNVPRV